MSTIKISELATGTVSSESLLAFADVNGLASKGTIKQIIGNYVVNSLLDFDSLILNASTGVWMVISDITLDANKTIPTGVTLQFRNAKINLGGFNLTGSNTKINTGLTHIFDTNGVLNGSWVVPFVYPQWFGADGGGIIDETEFIQKAIDFSIITQSKVHIPAGDYLVDNIEIRTNMFIVGDKGVGSPFEGTRLLVKTDNYAVFRNSELSDKTTVTIKDLKMLPNAGVLNTRGILQDDNSFYLSFFTFENIETFADFRCSYEGNFIYGVWTKCRDGFHGTPSTHSAIEDLPVNPGQFKQANLNKIEDCSFFQSKNVNASVQFSNGSNILFESCDWELLQTPAVQLNGMFGANFLNCWFESITASYIVKLSVDGRPQGSRQVVFDNCLIDMQNTTTNFIDIFDSCSASLKFCSFAGVTSSMRLSSVDARIREFTGNEVLSSPSAQEYFFNQIQNSESTIKTSGLVSRTRVNSTMQSFNVLKQGLTDAPTSPETVSTFTFPSETILASQRGEFWILDIEATVEAVGGTTTIYAYETQKIRLAIHRVKGGALVSDISSSGSIPFVGGGGFWTTTPVWSATVSGNNVILKVTSNPGGNTYEINSRISGILLDNTTFVIYPEGTETSTSANRDVTII